MDAVHKEATEAEQKIARYGQVPGNLHSPDNPVIHGLHALELCQAEAVLPHRMIR